jgi:hypothetical protein
MRDAWGVKATSKRIGGAQGRRDETMDLLTKYSVYIAESCVILSVIVFVLYILYSLGLLKSKK